MATEWNIRDIASKCNQCERAFEDGEEVFSGLVEREDAEFERLDLCRACRDVRDPSEFFSRWRTMRPAKDQPVARRVNGQMVLDFFHRLEGSPERRKECLRYTLALMLMRKKIMKFRGVEHNEQGEQLALEEARSGTIYRVTDPHLDGEEIATLTEEVGRLLNLDVEAGEGAAEAGGELEDDGIRSE